MISSVRCIGRQKLPGVVLKHGHLSKLWSDSIMQLKWIALLRGYHSF